MAVILLVSNGALVLNTGSTPIDREREALGEPLDRMWRDCVLDYCGIKNVHRELYGVVATSTPQKPDSWLARTEALATQVASTIIERMSLSPG